LFADAGSVNTPAEGDKMPSATMIELESFTGSIRRDGFVVVPNLISGDLLARAQTAIERIVETMRAEGIDTFSETLDPNDANLRLYHLAAWDPVFIELLRHPVACALVEACIGPQWLVSNFTSNVALPGSGSMNVHSDQALVVPPTWNEPWAINVIWCLDDVHEANGATRYVPGSQHWTRFEDVPDNLLERSVPFSAPAGSIVAMEGRVWHTSGANETENERRAMAFAYYTRDFIRPQVNWAMVMPPEAASTLDDKARAMLGMSVMGNTTIGGSLTRLREGKRPDLRVAPLQP
jgi:ectoine hydroxylase-related dioxygenase (phytanoyl-CoA dioxygenase family)